MMTDFYLWVILAVVASCAALFFGAGWYSHQEHTSMKIDEHRFRRPF